MNGEKIIDFVAIKLCQDFNNEKGEEYSRVKK
jgi:hypothetical protein